MADTTSLLIVKDGQTPPVPQNIGGTKDGTGIFYPENNLRFDGTLAGAATPFPTVNAVANIALGTPADTAWSGSGSSTIVAALKAVWTLLNGTLATKTALRTLVPLDVATVTTGGTAVTALTAGHRTGGGWIMNPTTATQPLGINEIGTATGTTSAGNTTFIAPGQTYQLSPSANAVSVIATDSAHAFSGYGYQ
jgi:hypothetical protein